jgi:hypothetical protein
VGAIGARRPPFSAAEGSGSKGFSYRGGKDGPQHTTLGPTGPLFFFGVSGGNYSSNYILNCSKNRKATNFLANYLDFSRKTYQFIYRLNFKNSNVTWIYYPMDISKSKKGKTSSC